VIISSPDSVARKSTWKSLRLSGSLAISASRRRGIAAAMGGAAGGKASSTMAVLGSAGSNIA
jgi:hypothetical protein